MKAIFHPCGELSPPLMPLSGDIGEPRARLLKDMKFLGLGHTHLDSKRVALWQSACSLRNHGSLPNDSSLIEKSLECCGGMPSTHDELEQLFEGWVLCVDGRLYHPRLCALMAETFNSDSLKALLEKVAFREPDSDGKFSAPLLLLSKEGTSEVFKRVEIHVSKGRLAQLHEDGALSRPSHVWGPRLLEPEEPRPECAVTTTASASSEEDGTSPWSQHALGAEMIPKERFPSTLLRRGAASDAIGPITAQHFRSVIPFFSSNPIAKINSAWKSISVAYGGGAGMVELDLCYQFCLAKKGESLNLAYFTKLSVELSPWVCSLGRVFWIPHDIKAALLILNSRASQELIAALAKVSSVDQQDYVAHKIGKAISAKGKDRDRKIFDLISDIEKFDVLQVDGGVEVVAPQESASRVDIYTFM